MNDDISSHTITCPHCWEPHQVLIDGTGGDQTYIEDCSVCCHPIELTIRMDDDGLSELNVEAAQ